MIHKITTVTEPFNPAAPTLLALSPGAKGKLTIPARLRAADRTIQAIAVEDIGALEAYLEKQVTEPQLTKPEEAKVIDVEGGALPTSGLALTQKGAIIVEHKADNKEEEAA